MKCSTQCPLAQQGFARNFEQSCVQNCSDKYMLNLTDKEKSIISSKKGKPGNLSAGYDYCINNMQQDSSFDYSACFSDFFAAHNDIANFSDYLRYPFGV
jgi:hypothetical protein